MDLLYLSSHNENIGQNLNSSAIQLDALLEELLIERQCTREKDIFPSSEKYGIIERCEKDNKVQNIPPFQQPFIARERVEEMVTDILLTNIKTERIEQNNYQLNSEHDSSKNKCARNETDRYMVSSPSEREFTKSNFSKTIVPGTQFTTTIQTYTYGIPTTKNIQSYNLNGLNEDETSKKLTENINANILVSSNKPLVMKCIERSEPPKSIEKQIAKINTSQECKYVQRKDQDLYTFNSQCLVDDKNKEKSRKYTFVSNTKDNSSLDIDLKYLNTKAFHSPSDSVCSNTFDDKCGLRKFQDNEQTGSEEIRHRIMNKNMDSVNASSPEKFPSINKVGTAVYYPPNQTLKKETENNYLMKGKYAKLSGKYEHESSYSEKTKTSSGGAVVPICLPLCCAMPCSVM